MKAKVPEKAAAETTAEAGPSSITKTAPATTTGSSNEGGPSSAATRDDPFVSNAANIAYWNQIASQSNFPTPQRGLLARRASSPTRPSSSSSALSASAEPFLPGGPSYSVESSASRASTRTIHADAQTSTDYLESPERLAELYDIGEDELHKHQTKGKGKGKEVARSPATPVSSFGQGEGVETTGEPSSSRDLPTAQTTLDFSSLYISKSDDEAGGPFGSYSREDQKDDDA